MNILEVAFFAVIATAIVSAAEATGCNKTIRTSFMVLNSPKWVDWDDRGGVSCRYHLIAHGGPTEAQVFEMRFLKMSVGQLLNGTCATGYLKLATSEDKLENSGAYCGHVTHKPLVLRETRDIFLELHVPDKATKNRPVFSIQVSVLPKLLALQRHKQSSQSLAISGPHHCDLLFVSCNQRNACQVSSPDFPGIYPRNITCRYRIVINENGGSSVAIGGTPSDTVDIMGPIDSELCSLSKPSCRSSYSRNGAEEGVIINDCPHDYIAVYDGEYKDKVMVSKFCGKGTFPLIVLRKREAFVEFTAAPFGSMKHNGFQIHVEELRHLGNERIGEIIPHFGKCYWKFNEKDKNHSGTIRSIKHWYPSGTSCKYKIAAKRGGRIFLQLVNLRNDVGAEIFYTTKFHHCNHANISIYDGASVHPSNLLGSYCVFTGELSDSGVSLPKFPHIFASSGKDLLIIYQNVKGSLNGRDISYEIKYQFENNDVSDDASINLLVNDNWNNTNNAGINIQIDNVPPENDYNCENYDKCWDVLKLWFIFLMALGLLSFIGAIVTLSFIICNLRTRRRN